MDDQLKMDSGCYHRSCAKCSECSAQLSLLNFSQLKGVLFCKPHFVARFKLRGKYDDVVASAAPSPKSPATVVSSSSVEAAPADSPASAASAPAEVAAVTEKLEAAALEEKPAAVAAPEPAPAAEAPAVAAAEAPAKEAPAAATPAKDAKPEASKAETFISGPSVKDRIKASSVTGAAKAKGGNDFYAAEAGASIEGQGSAAAPAHTGPSGSAGIGVAFTSPLKAAAPAAAAATPATPKAAAAPSASGSTPSAFGGGGSKCATCAKTVYAADPSVASGGSTWHRS